MPVAQLDRASASGAEGYRFNSCRAYFPQLSSIVLNPCQTQGLTRSRGRPPGTGCFLVSPRFPPPATARCCSRCCSRKRGAVRPGRTRRGRFTTRGVVGRQTQLGDRSGRVPDADVGVPVHCQSDGRVPRQLLRVFRRHPRPDQFGNERVPQRVEVGDPAVPVAVAQEVRTLALAPLGGGRRLIDPGGAGDLQVAADHVHGLGVLRPLPRPHRHPGRLADQPPPQFRDQIRVQWDRVTAAVLGVRGLHHDSRRVGRQLERLRREAGQLARPQPRRAADQVQHPPVRASHLAVHLPAAGGVKDAGVLLRRQRTAFVPDINVFVYLRDVSERVLGGAAGLHQPVTESDQRLPVVVARRRPEPALCLRHPAPLGEPALRRGRVQVLQCHEPDSIEHELTGARPDRLPSRSRPCHGRVVRTPPAGRGAAASGGRRSRRGCRPSRSRSASATPPA